MEILERPILKLIAENSATHQALADGIGEAVLRTFTNRLGLVQIDLDQLIAALIDALGLALAAKTGASVEAVRETIAYEVATDIYACVSALQFNENADRLGQFKKLCK